MCLPCHSHPISPVELLCSIFIKGGELVVVVNVGNGGKSLKSAFALCFRRSSSRRTGTVLDFLMLLNWRMP